MNNKGGAIIQKSELNNWSPREKDNLKLKSTSFTYLKNQKQTVDMSNPLMGNMLTEVVINQNESCDQS